MQGLERRQEEKQGPVGQQGRPAPDPQVPEKARRRRFTASYKLEILRAADRCSAPGEVGSLLRREGLYSSHLVEWRRQRERGTLAALAPRKRGRMARPVNPQAVRIAELERENQRLRRKLEQAQTIIEVQKKLSEILGLPVAKTPELGEEN